jgi:hypothetical protein
VTTVTVEVDVDLEQFETEELETELRFRRKRSRFGHGEYDLLHEAHDYLLRGNHEDALLAISKFLFPKFKDEGDCLKKYREARVAA